MGGESQNISGKNSKSSGSVKKKLGQFYTHNYEYIFQGFDLEDNLTIIEPFAGDGQLCSWCEDRGYDQIECYDIAPMAPGITKRDTLKDPPEYKGKFVVTNPPYLARNKSENKEVYDLYKTNDLYKCFIRTLIEGEVHGGIIIVPLNFLCDNHCTDVRDEFLSKYSIDKLNIFEETVFRDTTYTVCSFQFYRSGGQDEQSIPTTFYPRKEKKQIVLRKEHDWKVGGNLYKKTQSKYKVSRLVQGMKPEKDYLPDELSKIFLYGVDSGSQAGRIRLVYNDAPFFGKGTDRAFLTLIIKPAISIEKQKKAIEGFNSQIESLRKKHNSLFLVNYRNSTKLYARKRIKFSMVYNMIKDILDNIDIVERL